MLNSQGHLDLGPYSDLYELVVPKDNQFRQFKELCNDFDFIYDELKNKYCPDNGRTAIDPRILFKYRCGGAVALQYVVQVFPRPATGADGDD